MDCETYYMLLESAIIANDTKVVQEMINKISKLESSSSQREVSSTTTTTTTTTTTITKTRIEPNKSRISSRVQKELDKIKAREEELAEIRKRKHDMWSKGV